MIIIKLIFIIILFINLNFASTYPNSQIRKLVEQNDECYSFIPEDILDQVVIFKPDRGGFRDQVIRSTPQKSKQSKNTSTNNDEKNTKLYYLLKNLQPNTQYAVRISYIASSPTEYQIKFFDNPLITTDVLNRFVQSEKKNRDLLNTEIIKFKTDDSGYVIESHDYNTLKLNPCSIITIESINLAITPSFVQNDLYKYQSFNIILDTELIGVPPEIPKVVILVLIPLILIFLIYKKYIINK